MMLLAIAGGDLGWYWYGIPVTFAAVLSGFWMRHAGAVGRVTKVRREIETLEWRAELPGSDPNEAGPEP